VPTEGEESDATFVWNETTLVVAEVRAGGAVGLGYTYGDRAAATVIAGSLADTVVGRDAMDVSACWMAMNRTLRNAGRPGIGATAISAVDVALWDLKARLLDLPLVTLLGAVREEVDVYGSGGFTSYSVDRLERQFGGWRAAGMTRMKMKVGREPAADPVRVRAARNAIGEDAELFLDANGAWTPAIALSMVRCLQPYGISWLEEPVSADDLEGLRHVRDRLPIGLEVAAGEYGYDGAYFLRMLREAAVDVLQADATRCGGITGFLQVGTLCDVLGVPLSAHTAPSLHVAPCCAVPRVRHVEYFHDHVLIEQRLFDGAARAVHGRIRPDVGRPGLGLELKRTDADAFRVM
jgi:L-alanine-DL-glutamate epimerase-like enolase superfamily enzyme